MVRGPGNKAGITDCNVAPTECRAALADCTLAGCSCIQRGVSRRRDGGARQFAVYINAKRLENRSKVHKKALL